LPRTTVQRINLASVELKQIELDWAGVKSLRAHVGETVYLMVGAVSEGIMVLGLGLRGMYDGYSEVDLTRVGIAGGVAIKTIDGQ
jgi:hypothetical protein